MALPTYASPLERVWHYAYLVICGLVFLFLIAPILIVIPLSFNAEPYFTFTPKMLSLDPEGWSLRWYDTLLTLGHSSEDGVRDSAWWCRRRRTRSGSDFGRRSLRLRWAPSRRWGFPDPRCPTAA
jgi:hypothetical protein